MAGDIYYQLLSENKQYKVKIDSQFILISELKRRICEDLGNTPINVLILKHEVALIKKKNRSENSRRKSKNVRMMNCILIMIIFDFSNDKNYNKKTMNYIGFLICKISFIFWCLLFIILYYDVLQSSPKDIHLNLLFIHCSSFRTQRRTRNL